MFKINILEMDNLANEVLDIPPLEFFISEIAEMDIIIKSWGISAALQAVLKTLGFLTIRHYENMQQIEIESTKIFEIKHLFTLNDCCLVLCQEWIQREFSDIFQSFIIDKISQNYLYCNILEFDGPPVHFYNLNNGLRVVRPKKYFK